MESIIMVATSTNKNRVVLVVDGEVKETKLNEGEILVELGDFNSLLKPKWDGSKWIESATQEEIDNHNYVPEPPSEIEKLKSELTTVQGAIDFIIMNY